MSDKTIQMDNKTTISSNESNGNRLVLLALEKAEDQKSDDFYDQTSEPGSLQIEELGKHSQLVETRSNRSSVISKTSSARRVHYLKIKPLKKQEEMQARQETLRREDKESEKLVSKKRLPAKLE